MTKLIVAQTILDQLGGKRFCLMTGAKKFVGSADSLQFQVPGAKDRIKIVRIVLNGSDLYDVTFGYLERKTQSYKIVSEAKGVYAEDLQDIFTANTGLYTRL